MMSFSYTDDRIRKTLRDMFMRREQTFRGDERGSALIEAAILTPLLIVLFIGVFEFSWFFYQQHLVVIGLHDAVSYLARSADPCNPTSRVWKTKQEHAKNLATSGTIKGGPPRVRGWLPAMVERILREYLAPITAAGGQSGGRRQRHRTDPVGVLLSITIAYDDDLRWVLGAMKLTPTPSTNGRSTH
jgi:hypothetical protein